jgi:tRNA1Val (adenine37-N6)-methyltransferase
MANDWFQFKQFTVQQGSCAMKVTTDACLFGAWAANCIKHHQHNSILDIGTGTGLLSLMLAQQSSATITAVEIDTNAAIQTAENFNASPWAERLKVQQLPIQEFSANTLFDIIISNPPFFDNDLKSQQTERNLALHSTALDFEDLIQSIDQHLSPIGRVFVLIPYHRADVFEKLAATKGLIVNRATTVQQTPTHDYFRQMLELSRIVQDRIEDHVIIKSDNQYTPKFIDLLKDYYLFL